MAFITLSQLTKAVKGLVNKINLENNVTNSKIGQLSSLNTTNKDNLVAAVNEVKTGAYSKPSTGIPNSDLAQDAQRGYTVDDAAKGEVILAEATYTEWEEVDDNPPYWNASYSSGAPDPETTTFPDAVIITLDGVPYKVPRTPAESEMASYGCLDDSQFPDFPQFFPVAISFWGGGFELFAQTSGDHTISVNAAKTEVTTTPDFDKAVASSTEAAMAATAAAIDEKLDTDGDAYRAASIPMGQLDSTSTSTVMTATVPGITELRDGVCVWLKNGVVTSASGFTLNINGLGAKPCYSSLAAATRSTTIFNASYTMLFIYNSTRASGGCWDVVYGYDSNTNTIGYQLRTNGTTLPMSSVTYRYRLLFTSADGTHFVPANNSSSTNATASRTVCQTPIDPHGMIFYYGTTSSVAANANPSGSYLWTRYTVTLGYSFNKTGAALVLSVNKPVYVKAAPQADGSAIIDADTPYVQDLPTTDDGKIYIFLGVTTSTTVVELVDVHPIYCNRNGRIQIWTGVEAEIDALKAQIAALDILDEEEF